MNPTDIFQPVVVLVFQTLFVLMALGISRSRAVKTREVPIKYYTEYQGEAESGRLRLLSRNYSNLFESPVLFYVGVLTAYATGFVDAWFINLAWIYVAARFLHTLIHVFYNNVNVRFAMFAVSMTVLVAFWFRIAQKVF